jgi:hypothetical protein
LRQSGGEPAPVYSPVIGPVGGVSQEALALAKSKVFERGGSVGIMNGAGELNVNANINRMTARVTVNEKNIFIEGTISIENGVLRIKNLGIRPNEGTYNSTNLVNEIGFAPFKSLLDELKEMRINAGFKEGVLEFERMRPDGSPLPDSKLRTIPF